jgi:hypothetical protein
MTKTFIPSGYLTPHLSFSTRKASKRYLREQVLLLMTAASTVLSLASLVVAWSHKSPALAMVDTQALVQHQSKQLAHSSPTGSINPEKLRQTATLIKAALENWARLHHTVLLAKGTVWGEGVVDVTDQLLTSLAEQG